MSDDRKTWEKPWNPQEIAENASNWSFAADLSLLKYLEVFSEDLLCRAETIDDNVNTLLNDLSKASLSLDIAKNKFLSLSNTQFIESRVYEDDETLLSNEDQIDKVEPVKNNTDEFNKNEMRLAALRGIEVIDEFFDKVEVVDSDSEEDNDVTSFVLRPRDPYINRPLPYVIGSEKWHGALHVGLEDSSSESENEKVIENYSDTDSESDLPITNRSQAKSISGSGSSEADFSNKLDHPVANSTLNDTNKHEDFLTTSQDYNSVSAQIPTSQNSFAEQLAAKLGNVINNAVEELPINTKPIQKTNNSDIYKNFFSDEPPPLDDMDDEFSPKSKDQGIFSGGDGLFDDLNDDEPFWGTNVEEKPKTVSNVPEKATDNLFEEENEDILSNMKENIPKPSDNDRLKKELEVKLNKKKETSIFDEDFESDEDSLFGKSLTTSKKSVNISKESKNLFADDKKGLSTSGAQSEKASTNLFDEDTHFKTKDNNVEHRDTSLFDEESNDSLRWKAPVGGIKVISNPNLFAGQDVKKILKNRPPSSSESDGECPPSVDITKSNRNVTQTILKGNAAKIEENNEDVKAKSIENVVAKSDNIFDDVDIEDDLFKDDLFSNLSSQKKKSSNLFGKSEGLFDDLEESDEENVMGTKNMEEKSKMSEENLKRSAEMFGENEESLQKDEEKAILKEQQSIVDVEDVKKPKEIQSIFSADEESDSDDLFSSKHSKIISKNKIIEDVSIAKGAPKKIPPSTQTQSKSIKTTGKRVPSLFDDDDEDVEDDLFSSSFLPDKRPTSKARTMRPEQNAPLPRRKNLFDEDIRDDDIFSEPKSSNDKKGVYAGDGLARTVPSKLEESSENKSVQDLVKPSSQSSSSNSEETDELEGERLQGNLFGSDIGENPFEPVQKNAQVPIEDPLFKDEDLEHDLFGSGNQKTTNNGNASKSAESVPEREEFNEHLGRNVGTIEEFSVTREENLMSKEKEDKSSEDVISKAEHHESEIAEGDNPSSFDKHEALSNNNNNNPSQNNLVPERVESQKEVEITQEEIQDRNAEGPRSNDDNPSTYVKIPEGPAPNKMQNLNVDGKNGDNKDNSSTMENLSIKNKFSSTVVGRIPSLNIFDPDPPSDPEDWDDRFEQNTFADDLYSFDNTDNFGENRSSIFDREPPSPAFNESSGIVRDQRSRIDTDVSSFYPYASSSRRFSNEILGEEQSNDSLFPTKSRHSIEPNIPPSISESAEFSASNLDITPSGKLDDLYFESSNQSKPVKSVTFEDGSDNKIEDDGFVGSPEAQTEERDSPDKTMEENREDSNAIKSKPVVSRKPELTKTDMPEETASKVEENKDDGSSPGKLKHNLNINVFALLPGAGKLSKKEAPSVPKPAEREAPVIVKPTEREAPVITRPQKRDAPAVPKPRKREAPVIPRPPQRSLSLDLDLDDHTDGTYERTLPVVKITRDPKSRPEKIQNNLDDVEVLESITKSRARGPVRRKPSTKRGRDAIRNSCIDFTFASDLTKELNENEEGESAESKRGESKTFKNELQAKLVQNARQVSFPTVEKTALRTSVLQERHVKTNGARIVNDSSSTKSEEISTSKANISTRSSPTTEDIPKISIETSHASEGTNTTANDRKSREDIFTNLEDVTRMEIKHEYAPKFAETSTSRIRKIDLIEQSKSLVDKNSEDEPKMGDDTSGRLRRMDLLNDLLAENEDDPFKLGETPKTKSSDGGGEISETSASRRFKRMDFISDLMSEELSTAKYDENKSDTKQTITTTSAKASGNTENATESNIETSEKHSIFEKSNVTTSTTRNTEDVFRKRAETSKQPPRKLDLFGDDLDEDDDLFSGARKKKRDKTTASFLSVDSGGGDSGLFDVTRRSSFVKTDNFASPEFIKDNLSEDEEDEDIFSEKKLPPKSDFLKRSSFVDDDEDDEDLLGQTSVDRKKASAATTITTRRLKVSGLKKLENVTVTGDDPLSALEK